MKKVLLFLAFAAALAACEKNQVPTWTNPDQQAVTPDGQAYDVRILPVMTKVTDTAFESGDAIGVSIDRTAGAYATNEKLTYNGTARVRRGDTRRNEDEKSGDVGIIEWE